LATLPPKLADSRFLWLAVVLPRTSGAFLRTPAVRIGFLLSVLAGTRRLRSELLLVLPLRVLSLQVLISSRRLPSPPLPNAGAAVTPPPPPLLLLLLLALPLSTVHVVLLPPLPLLPIVDDGANGAASSGNCSCVWRSPDFGRFCRLWKLTGSVFVSRNLCQT
jgi:hypothetical protein